MILLMTVNPGFGGQKLIPGTLAKISQLRAILDQKGLSIPIEVDGGVNDETIYLVIEAGAHVIVAGSAVFGGEIGQNYRKLTAHFPQSV